MAKNKNHQMSIVVGDEDYISLKKYAAQKNVPCATVVRNFISEGLKIKGYSKDIEFIRQIVRQEIETVIHEQLERMIKIEVKSAKASAIAMYFALSLLSEEYSDDKTAQHLLAKASKQADLFVKRKEKTESEYLKEAEDIIADANKIVKID